MPSKICNKKKNESVYILKQYIVKKNKKTKKKKTEQ